jgi:hypothetical protein
MLEHAEPGGMQNAPIRSAIWRGRLRRARSLFRNVRCGRLLPNEAVSHPAAPGHKEPVAVAFQFSAIRSFSGADVER